MGKAMLEKFKESLMSVLPVTLIVVILNIIGLADFSGREITVFLACSVFLVLGIGFFSLGADMAMSPMGEHVGAGLSKSKNLALLLSVCLAMGVLITIAEPDLTVLANQVKDAINGTALIYAVGIGVGVFLLIAVIKIVFHIPLSSVLMFFYLLMFSIALIAEINGKGIFLALSFDSGGVTTGPITVPFIMALGVGIAATLGGKNVSENSFGLIAMCSVGPMIAVLVLALTANGEMTYTVSDEYFIAENVMGALLGKILATFKEVLLAIGLIVVFFLILQIAYLKLPWRHLKRMAIGIVYTVLGLVMFLTSVSIGFMPVGYKLGSQLAQNPALLVVFGFIIGMVIVLAEPAVYVLNKQVEEITDKAVSKKSMMIALSIGVGISIALSMLRIVFDFNIMYYLVPGYILSIGLSFFVPGLYTAIAFDSGGVASGPLTSGFILPFAVGACAIAQGADKIMSDAFGVVAMVAMTPLITIQLLGFSAIMKRRVHTRIAMRRILSADDEQIISFM